MESFRTYLFKAADAAFGPLLCRMIGLWYVLRSPRSMPRAPALAEIRRIMLIRPGGMGDMIILLPTLRALQKGFPEARIDIVCERRNRPVLELAGLGGNALVYDANPLQFLGRLSRRKYDLAVDSEQFHHFSAIFAALSGAKLRIGFKINPRRNALYTHLINYAPDGPEIAQFEGLLQPLGIDGHAAKLEGVLEDTHLQLGAKLENTLARTFGQRPFAVVHTGASSRYKQWPPLRFAEVLRQLKTEHGMGSVLVGSRRDMSVGASVAARVNEAGGTVISLVGQMDLPRVGALIRKAALYIGADSGLAHLAVAVDTPSVVLFGSSDHNKWGFENAHHTVVRKDIACAPCAMFGYNKPCRHISCMERIAVPDVMAACAGVLEARQLTFNEDAFQATAP